MTTMKQAPPEDEAFDHRSIMSDNTTTHRNLVRGASTSNRNNKAPSAYTGNLSFIEEDSGIRNHPKGEHSEVSLVANAAPMGSSNKYQDLEYADPYHTERDGLVTKEPNAFANTAFGRLMSKGRYPMQQRIEDKKRGIGRQKYPFVVWSFSVVMVAVMIYELIVNWKAQGTPISFKPVTNVMLGPSWSALINVGGRFPPCMKLVTDAPPTVLVPCLNATTNPPETNRLCTIEEVCGFGGFGGKEPNQWFRFITPVFLHAGIIHILLNLFAQLTISAQIEKEMGSGGFLLTYLAAGIFGNVLGGNFSLVGSPSTGASGAIFGTLAVLWVDLFAHWKYHYRPVRKLVFMLIDLAVGIAIGFIPFVDNFAHLGGLFMGLLFGMIFYPIISETKRHKTIVWALRVAAIPVAIVMFVVLTRNFYTSDPYAGALMILTSDGRSLTSLFFILPSSMPRLPILVLYTKQHKQPLQRDGYSELRR
ncbi:rhomboid-domain-containing protein [Marasmius fiardii PR-910]|nr:rhomboid-domain-containing protein [Marasmius fiardii PR-910]